VHISKPAFGVVEAMVLPFSNGCLRIVALHSFAVPAAVLSPAISTLMQHAGNIPIGIVRFDLELNEVGGLFTWKAQDSFSATKHLPRLASTMDAHRSRLSRQTYLTV
jgi:hypothetical protein